VPTNRRYISRRRSVSQVAELNTAQEFALLVGPTHAVWAGCDPDDLEFWEAAWSYHGKRLLENWIARYPGSRPWAWWQFDSPELRVEEDDQDDEEIDDQEDDAVEEEAAARLHRAGLIGPAELEAIRIRALALAQHNRGRRPDRPGDNFIPPDGADRLAIALGLLSDEEAAVLADSPKFSTATEFSYDYVCEKRR
jgi:hypothetical protein